MKAVSFLSGCVLSPGSVRASRELERLPGSFGFVLALEKFLALLCGL